MLSISNIKPLITRSFGRSTLVVKKFSPEILTVVGVVGVIAAAVVASKATLRLEPVVDKLTESVDLAKRNKAESLEGAYSDKEYVRDMGAAYTRAVLDLSKLYGPAVTLGLTSITCIVGAHGIMRKRNVALVAAYKAVEQSFAEYRKRVTEDYGQEKDLEYRVGVRKEEEVDEKSGKKVSKKVIDPNGISVYARFFDEFNVNWEKEAEYNLFFLRSQQNYANDLLKARGHIFLNEVYDMVGIERSGSGAVVGWVLSKDGDNFVDFGIYDFNNTNFVNGNESVILLDFNVDGLVYDKI